MRCPLSFPSKRFVSSSRCLLCLILYDKQPSPTFNQVYRTLRPHKPPYMQASLGRRLYLLPIHLLIRIRTSSPDPRSEFI